MIRTIYAAIAAPGAGKTKSLITMLPDLLRQGEMFVIAFPTLNLCNDVITEMHRNGLNPRVINSQVSESKSASKVINGVLRNGNGNLVIVTHEGLRLSDPTLMRGYTLVIDEVPDVFEFQHILNLSQTEATRILNEVDMIDGLLQIKMGRMTAIKDRIRTYKSAEKDKSVTSTLSKAEFQIFNTLTTKGMVHLETMERPGSTSYNFFTIECKSILKHIQKSKEAHILAANISGGLFDCFATLNGYQIKKSKFTPANFEYSCPITIYPMLDQPWSKRKVLTDRNGIRHDKHLGKPEEQIIDQIFRKAIKNSPNEKFIAVQNSWGKFNKSYISPEEELDIEFPNLDCRGLNTLKDRTAAILMFSGQPSPNDKKSLGVIAKKYNIEIGTLKKSWIVKNKLEASLQAATRTSVRCRNNKRHIHLYVQDMEVAEYLKSKYMRNAKIDNGLTLAPTDMIDSRSNHTRNERLAMLKFIESAHSKGIKRSVINRMIAERWPMTLGNARKITKHLSRTRDGHPEDLSRFFA